MKILWITNIIFPEPSIAIGQPSPVSGGWMYGSVNQIVSKNNIDLAVATTYSGKELRSLNRNGIAYYLIPVTPKNKYQKKLEYFWKKICDEYKPDLIHIHGTEYPRGLACMRACPSFKFVISIQGLTGVIAKYHYAGIPILTILKHITLRDILRQDTIIHGKINRKKNGKFEKEYFKRTNHVIGRTSFDYAHSKFINRTVNYHSCNRYLRDGFYKAKKWEISNKNNFSIFLSQSERTIKGLHQLLKAVGLLLEEFPNIKVRVAGRNITKTDTFYDRLKISGYGSYIRSLIKKLGLQEVIEFTGHLNEEKMINEYQHAHVFVCPSSIENSPNSLGEAQIIGVPCVASYAGGIPDMVVHNRTGLLYRYEEVEMLAENIRRIFKDNELALKLSANSIQDAEQRHDRTTVINKTIEIYRKIVEKE
jgi:glycosyltransferase involved in cell wall biosynthesis